MQVTPRQPDEPITGVRSDETVDELCARLPESEWVITRGMLIKRIGDPPTAEDIEDFQRIARTRGRGPAVAGPSPSRLT